MTAIKIILLILFIMICLGALLVRYALSTGMHVPTNKELINGTKAVIASKNNTKQTPIKEAVKASDIKKLKP